MVILTLNYGEDNYRMLAQAGSTLELPTASDVGENHVFAGWFTDEARTLAWTDDMMIFDE